MNVRRTRIFFERRNVIYSGGKNNPDLLIHFIRKEQMKAKRSNKSRKTVMFVPEIQCSFLTLKTYNFIFNY